MKQFSVDGLLFHRLCDSNETMKMNTASFTVSDLRRQQQDSTKAWLEFLDLPTLSMGIYHVSAGTNDRETHEPHDRDEVYVGIDGRGRLNANGEEFDIEAGAIIYVSAGVVHYFHNVTDDLTVLVFFVGRPNLHSVSLP